MYVAEDGCQFGIHGKELDKLLLPFIPRCFFHFPPEMFGYYSTPSLYLQRQLTFHAGGCHNDVDRTIWGMQLWRSFCYWCENSNHLRPSQGCHNDVAIDVRTQITKGLARGCHNDVAWACENSNHSKAYACCKKWFDDVQQSWLLIAMSDTFVFHVLSLQNSNSHLTICIIVWYSYCIELILLILIPIDDVLIIDFGNNLILDNLQCSCIPINAEINGDTLYISSYIHWW